MITCRICGMTGAPHDDAVLLCDLCRAAIPAMIRHIADVVCSAEQVMAARMHALSTNDTARYLALCIARRDARGQASAWMTFQRRYAATLQQGGPLADLLEAESARDRMRVWAQQARAQIDALEVEHAHA